MTTDSDFLRLENKVDKLTDAVMRLVLIEERQTTQGERIGACEAKIAVNESAIAKTGSSPSSMASSAKRQNA
jgi:hypothetical protein